MYKYTPSSFRICPKVGQRSSSDGPSFLILGELEMRISRFARLSATQPFSYLHARCSFYCFVVLGASDVFVLRPLAMNYLGCVRQSCLQYHMVSQAFG